MQATINNVAFNADPKPRYPQTPLIETIHADADRDLTTSEGEGRQRLRRRGTSTGGEQEHESYAAWHASR